ncbi:MAG: holo-ACP synthase [bacterium]
MIYGIGTDLIETGRFKEKLNKNDEKIFTRLFSAKEIAYCRKGAQKSAQARCFAARFAAKEAFVKALGMGLRKGLRWTDIEIINNSSGKPLIHVYNKADRTVKDKEIRNIHVSISHARNHASAMVILEK